MPIMTHIVVLFADAAEQPRLPLWVTRAIRVVESPPAGSRSFTLHVSEGGCEWEARLSAEDARRLALLLDQMPAQGMTADVASFDGITYGLALVRAEQALSFQWQNEDWRYDPTCPREEWERVAAVAEYVLGLAGNSRPATDRRA